MNRLISLETGEVDMITQPPAPDIEKMKEDSNFTVYKTPGMRVFFAGAVTNRAPLDSVVVRKALNQAVDREKILTHVLEGVGTDATGFLSPGVFGYLDLKLDQRYPYDPEAAESLVTSLGYQRNDDGWMEKDGQELQLTIGTPAGHYYKDREIAEVLQSDFRAIGIQTEVETVEWAAYLRALLEGTHDCYLFMLGWSTINADAALMSMFHTNSMPPNGYNYLMYSNEQVDNWLDEGRRETDPEARQQIYEAIQEQPIEDSVWIPIYNPEVVSNYRASPTIFAGLWPAKFPWKTSCCSWRLFGPCLRATSPSPVAVAVSLNGRCASPRQVDPLVNGDRLSTFPYHAGNPQGVRQ